MAIDKYNLPLCYRKMEKIAILLVMCLAAASSALTSSEEDYIMSQILRTYKRPQAPAKRANAFRDSLNSGTLVSAMSSLYIGPV